ncbi:MAG: hypothetical protein H0X30_12470 [Anaerolineae bacterium]|nr:hypothetical protein [Anaerolineae bacterium]
MDFWVETSQCRQRLKPLRELIKGAKAHRKAQHAEQAAKAAQAAISKVGFVADLSQDKPCGSQSFMAAVAAAAAVQCQLE